MAGKGLRIADRKTRIPINGIGTLREWIQIFNTEAIPIDGIGTLRGSQDPGKKSEGGYE